MIGKRAVTVDDMGKLPYLEACLRETLRLYPTAPFFTLKAKGDQVVGDGKYLLKDGQQISVVLSKFHRDPEVSLLSLEIHCNDFDKHRLYKVYGTDAEEFRPERMYKEAFTNLPENSWKPFVRLHP